MTISFQNFAVGAIVTVAHLAVIVAIKPATLEASKYFQALKMDAFVEEVLVKHEANTEMEPLEIIPEMLSKVEVEVEAEADPEPENEPVPAPKEKAPLVVPDSTVEFAESFIDLKQEMDSMKAVTDVRVFSGRIEQPTLRRATPVEAPASSEAASKKPEEVATPVVEKPAAKKPTKSGPFNLREIRPVSRP